METEISKAHFRCNKSGSPEIEENLKEILNECEEESHVMSELSSTSSACTTTSDKKVDEESTILSTETGKDQKELSTTEINAMRKRIRFSSTESDSRFDDDEYKWLDFRLGDVPDGILRVPFPLYVDSGSDGSIDDFSDLDPTDLFADSLQGLEWAQRELAELQEAETRPVIPMYPHGPQTQTECFVCFEEVILRRRMCCKFPICDSCLESYLKVQVNQGTVKIECPNSDCQSYIHRDEIFARLPTPMKSKFYKFLIDANLDQCLKTCPRCSEALHVDRTVLKKRSVKKKGLLVECPNCSLEWCFTCHAPWHKGLSCKGFRKGDHLLKEWAREYHFGQINAQKCPKCKIFIQRDLGCDHMTCNRCGTEFCYRCGERYLGCKWLGNHLSRLSPFGCRYNFMPEKPHMRRIIRGSVLGGKLLGMMALSGFVVAAGAFLLGVGVIALPTWGAYKLHKRLKERRRSHPRIKRSKHPIIFIPSDPFFIRRTGGSGTRTDNSDLQISMDDRNDLRRVLFDFQLAGSQRVEVVVHQPVLSTGNQEDYEASGGTGDANSEPPFFTQMYRKSLMRMATPLL